MAMGYEARRMGEEKWKPIGRYYVSTEGRVKTETGRILSGCIKGGRVVVHLADRQVTVSKLVADAFIEGSGKVYHKNGDITDNRLCNLERR